MHPPKATDEAIRGLIREMAAAGEFPSGAALRRTLEQKVGSRGGVARIYKLLSAERRQLAPTIASSLATGLLEQENRNLREQLRNARQREDAHQVYWTREVGQLRQRIEALEPLVLAAPDAGVGAVPNSVSHKLRAAEIRVGQLEVSLRAFGPATGRREDAESE